MNNQGIGSWIYRRARMTPWKNALIEGDYKWTYSELNRKINRLAHGFRSLGIQKGDRIAYLNENHTSYLETLFASGLLGAIFVPLNMKLSPADIEHILDKAGCKILIYGYNSKVTVENLKTTARGLTYITLDADSKDDLTLNALISDQPHSLIDEVVSLDETALLAFTSGTTGKPKGVILSHKNLTWNVFNLMSCTDFLADDIILVSAPLHRMGALGVTVLPGIFKGATLLISAEPEIKKVVDVIRNQKVSILFGGPDFYQLLGEYLTEKENYFSSIRFCIVGGDVVPPALVQRWLDRGIQFQQGYGLTEAAPVALLLDKEEMLTKNGSAGRPVFFIDIRVVSQDLKDADPGESGEIILNGPNITKGYWNDPILTGERITHDNWLHSGDAARIDEDDHVYVLGRLRDGIMLNGKIVYPSEIEGLIAEQPEVSECAVIGVQGKKSDRIAVFIVPKDSKISLESDLLRLWSVKLPGMPVPQSVRVVESLPKNANGKVIRQKLRELYYDLELADSTFQ
jgi:fatty-acyl-CoA synthase